MSSEHIFYRNEKIHVEENGCVTIESDEYLVINSLSECQEHFKETEEGVCGGFNFLEYMFWKMERLDFHWNDFQCFDQNYH
jgi:hypothetical protein